MSVRLAVRGFIAGAKVLEEFPTFDDDGARIEKLAESNATYLMGLPGGDRHMIEIEFLDEPNPLQRFFRIGTDPAGMTAPVAVRLP